MRLINKALLASALTALALEMCVSAQDTRPKFEVASVKPSSVPSTFRGIGRAPGWPLHG